jgi:mevalonate kinase
MSNVKTSYFGLTKTTRDILKHKQQNQQKEIESMKETLDDFMKDQKSGEAIKNNNSNKLFEKILINYLKLSVIAIMITTITLLIIFGLSNI